MATLSVDGAPFWSFTVKKKKSQSIGEDFDWGIY